ncbi:MAG: hypothetical protein CXZ00_02425 [Acidobacteria bacterium]|nr:MAG: hypothetical protein CXZ00_02425 [Acidobacteriota bacterium]
MKRIAFIPVLLCCAVLNRECPLVRIDHEEILCNWRIKVVEQVRPSFLKITVQVIQTSCET